MDHSTHHHGSGIQEWSDLTFSQLWSPFMFVSILVVLFVYLKFAGSIPAWRKWMFAGGLFFIYVASGSPLAILGHDYMFSAHMMQQSILYLVVPPFLLLGLPSWWFQSWANKRWVEVLMKIIEHPLFALLNFNVFFSFYHIPQIFDAMTDNHLLHYAYHTWLQICAVQMWLLIVNPLPVRERLRPLQKIGYIFANGVLLTPACALIIFASDVIYDTYANTPVVFDMFSKLDDQQLGGVIMKLMQEAAYGLTLGIIFYRWFYQERSQEKAEREATVTV
jgi:putative membrane protein